MLSSVSYNFSLKNKRQDKLNNLAISFTSKVKTVHQGTLPANLYAEVDKFEETHNIADSIGAGLFARVYILKGTPYVIKESLDDSYAKKANDRFYPEAKMLACVPDKLTNSQHLVANVETEKGNFYLLSTFVNGSAADCQTQPWNRKHFNGLIKTLYELDEAGIYHNDVNQANCLLDKDSSVKVIDYQFGVRFAPYNNFENSKNFKCPSFLMPSNAQMFEMSSLPYYLRDMQGIYPKSAIRETFKDYLKTKSEYCRQRAAYLQPIDIEKSKYESLQSKYYKNPTDNMIDLQALKLQLMYAHRKTFSIVDPNGKNDKNIISAVPSYIYTATCAKKMSDFAKMLKSKTTNDNDLKEFLDYEIKFGEYWQDQMLTELLKNNDGGVLDWVNRNARLSPKHEYHIYNEDWERFTYDSEDLGVPEGEDLSQKFKISEDMEFGQIEDVASLITSNKESNIHKTNSFANKIDYIKKECSLLKEKMQMEEKDFLPEDKSNRSVLIQLSLHKEKYKDCCNQMFHAINEGAFNVAIPTSIKATYLAALFEEKADEEYAKSKDETFKKYLTQQKNSIDKFSPGHICYHLCKMFESAIKSSKDEKILDNINNFDAKN